MKTIVTYFRNLQWRQILTVLLAGVLLCVSTACNSGDVRGARPENPPVQMGGQNNPHKAGGDPLNKYKSSPKPQAMIPGSLLIAAVSNFEEPNPGLLYREDTETDERELPLIRKDTVKASPSGRQPVIDRSNPNERILEKTQEAFKEGSDFIKGAAEQVSPRRE